ncbi:myeloid-associated differentiation marker homolog [Alosa sapidissima]|uniref:myeloid-associated differentiation marker homolog n=1 Tax=Alosa sapidissima TaxID=34773 RepID=UPI001C082266|nr:myeloid-associated differentiation marker homolog [Alosa sapidissima]XP_041959092.1 myeloid-associated differentiation marker homolog [Alosa sapidissima]
MPVILGEVSILTTPLSGVRIWALVSGCVTFSLVASMVEPTTVQHSELFRTFCMSTWCLFFTLSLLILIITYIQFHSLLPLSWKNLTVTVAAMAALMVFTATLAYPCLALSENTTKESVIATIFSGLTFLAYATETHLIRREQKGYMATVPGLLKVLQVFGGCMGLLLIADQVSHRSTGWEVAIPGMAYGLCLSASLGTVVVMVGDCAGRCPLPFDRVLAGLSSLGVLLYMVAAVVSSTKVLNLYRPNPSEGKLIIVSEMAFACITLVSYTVDLAFSVKLLCDRI